MNHTIGYATAWLRYRLEGDTVARGAFAGPNPELPTNQWPFMYPWPVGWDQNLWAATGLT